MGEGQVPDHGSHQGALLVQRPSAKKESEKKYDIHIYMYIYIYVYMLLISVIDHVTIYRGVFFPGVPSYFVLQG